MKKTGLTIRIEEELRLEITEKAQQNNLTVFQYVRKLLWDKHFIQI